MEASERVTLTNTSGGELTGWALNLSRGGLRAILEENVELGAEFAIAIGDEPPKKRGRIVWIQEEPDGAIVGIEFLGVPEGAGAPPPPEPKPSPAGGSDPGA
jgi:PilZ domain